MEGGNRLPPELPREDLAKEWPAWKRTFLIYMNATGKIKESESQKIAIFLWLAGKHATDIYNTLFTNDGTAEAMLGGNVKKSEKADGAVDKERLLTEVLAAFDKHCVPKRNKAVESFKFNSIAQSEGQSISDFETKLRKQAAFCEYQCSCGASYEERMVRDRIILGVLDKKLQLKLLEGQEDELQSILDKCRVSELAGVNKKIITAAYPLASVSATQVGESVGEYNLQEQAKGSQLQSLTRNLCYNCGAPFSLSHLRVCKANGITCGNCGRQGHFRKFCKQSKVENKTFKTGSNRDNMGIVNNCRPSSSWKPYGKSALGKQGYPERDKQVRNTTTSHQRGQHSSNMLASCQWDSSEASE